jgi:hypothetical protein
MNKTTAALFAGRKEIDAFLKSYEPVKKPSIIVDDISVWGAKAGKFEYDPAYIWWKTPGVAKRWPPFRTA